MRLLIVLMLLVLANHFNVEMQVEASGAENGDMTVIIMIIWAAAGDVLNGLRKLAEISNLNEKDKKRR